MKRLTAVDLFSGAGGATQGLRDAGFDVIGAVENDPKSAETYRLNHPGVKLWTEDVRAVPARRMARELDLSNPGDLTILKACPPCQGFSSLAEGRVEYIDQDRNDLVLDTVRFVRELRPSFVMLENVPGLGRDARSTILQESLRGLGYASKVYFVNATDFGVPQRRRRLIILAARGLRSELPETLGATGLGDEASTTTVRRAFDELATAIRESDPLNVARTPSPLSATRIAAIPIGGNRFDLPDHLQLTCHKDVDSKRNRAATGSYGRMKWGEPSPTMTTRCTTVACGSFIHPEHNRGITLREAASLQTFPYDYDFVGSYEQIERQIGNAVPVRMAAQIASRVRQLAEQV